MVAADSHLAIEILKEAITARPVVLSKTFGGYLLQCNGRHFIQDPSNEAEIALSEAAINSLVDAGYLCAEEWNGPNRNLYLTAAGRSYQVEHQA